MILPMPQGEHHQHEDAIISEDRAQQADARHHKQAAHHHRLAPVMRRDCAQNRAQQARAIRQGDDILNAAGCHAEARANRRNKRVGEAPRDIDNQAAEDDGGDRPKKSLIQIAGNPAHS